MRKLEYLDEAATNHHLLAESIWFEVECPMGSGHMMQVPSMDCYRHDRSGMQDVTINIRSAKNDQAGIGHRFTCKRADLTTSKQTPVRPGSRVVGFCLRGASSAGNGVPHVAGALSPYVREV